MPNLVDFGCFLSTVVDFCSFLVLTWVFVVAATPCVCASCKVRDRLVADRGRYDRITIAIEVTTGNDTTAAEEEQSRYVWNVATSMMVGRTGVGKRGRRSTNLNDIQVFIRELT